MADEMQGANREAGIVRGWSWRPDASCRPLQSWPDVQTAWQEEGCRIWIDVEKPARSDIEALDRIIDLDDRALEDCLNGPERPRIDE